ncbi:MAG: AAA domain-containing protein [Flavobacterium sp.]|nr:AAA domain-containing protein [Flavobacterium sp.]
MTFHETILTHLFEYRKRNPNFKFIPRQRNSKGRLEDGFWFQGNDSYAFVGLIDRSGGVNKTRSLGLVFWPKENNTFGYYLELVYKGESDKMLLAFYDKIRNHFSGFNESGDEKFVKQLGETDDSFETVYKFLDLFYPELVQLVNEENQPDLIIENQKFETIIARINEIRNKTIDSNMNKLLVNISWNSKDWKEESKDKSNHQWVRNGGIPSESWNFAIDAEGNTDKNIFGYAKFTHQPKIQNTSIFVFYSDGKIVGFYGDASLNETERNGHTMNLCGSQSLSFVLNNKIENVLEKGYFEEGKRIGQIGFNYLNKNETIIKILDEALELNPEQKDEIIRLKNWFIDVTNSKGTTKHKEVMSNDIAVNQILYGPPGTGKTFNSINEALKIVDPAFYQTNKNDRKKLTERFKELLIKNSEENKGQIAFCTFHQSFSYEDFVEGIKPKATENKQVYYDIEDGIFKRICLLADSFNSTVKVKSEGKISWNEEQFKKASFYKLSLGNYQDPTDKPIYEYCRDNNYISIGFGQENDFTGLSESEIKEKCDDLKLEVTAAQQMNFFIHYLKKGNYVIISNGNKYVRALGKVVGDYEYEAESPIRYNHFRKVEWIFVDELIPIEEIYDRGLSQKTMYKIDESALKQDFFISNGQETFAPIKEEKNYVLIIDEINRGNVSSIFGELITLIEKDKRAGKDEELEVILPYSKIPFKVPENVYIIGTMNTADRSIEALDTALRRRFSFKEFPPKSEILKTEGVSGKEKGIVNGIDLEILLNTINARIEKLIDKDHKIGHSYFLKVNSIEKLKFAFKNEIIPLLEEYFFGDYGKIGLVIGVSFVEKVNHSFEFAAFEDYDNDVKSDLKEKAVFRIRPEDQWDFTKI